MRKPKRSIFTILATVLLCLAGASGQDVPVALDKVVKRDASPLPLAGQMIMSYRAAVKAARSSVVKVEAEFWGASSRPTLADYDWNLESRLPSRRDQPKQVASGIVLTQDGLILTNCHVVNGSSRIALRSLDQTSEVEAEILGSDPATDVALLRAKGGAWVPCTLADSDLVEVGDVVLALGNPLGLEHSVSLGIISGIGRSGLALDRNTLQDFIQTDASVHPGNSGGPLVDAAGRVVGLTTACYGSETLGLAVPCNLALKVAQDLLAKGYVQRGTLGIRMTTLAFQSAESKQVEPGTRGILVTQVEKGGSADKAGLLPGDVIVALNKQPVLNAASLLTRMTLLAPGDRLQLQSLRGKAKHDVEVVLGAAVTPKGAAPALEWDLVPGLRVALLDKALRDKHLLPPDFQALLVLGDFVQEGQVRLKKGDFIVKINHQTLHSASSQPDPVAFLKMTSPVLLMKVQRGDASLLVGIVQ